MADHRRRPHHARRPRIRPPCRPRPRRAARGARLRRHAQPRRSGRLLPDRRAGPARAMPWRCTSATAPRRWWPAWSPAPSTSWPGPPRHWPSCATDGLLAGIHFEGPYISTGALRRPRPRAAARAVAAGVRRAAQGRARARAHGDHRPRAARRPRRRSGWPPPQGVIAALGHSDATYEQTLARHRGGRDRRHPPLQRACRRSPTATPARSPRCWRTSAVTVELINDGVHVHPAMLRLAYEVAGPAGPR